MRAIRLNGSDEIVRILLDAGADARWKDYEGRSPITLACGSGRGVLSFVETLLNHDHDLLEFSSGHGFTPLSLAINYNGETEVVRFLLERGANVHSTSEAGMTILMTACHNRCLESMRLLLADGADPHARDLDKQTALHHAAASGFFAGMRELILDHNADMLAVDNYGCTPFDEAVDYEEHETVDCLLHLFGNKVAHVHGRLALHALLRAAKCQFHPPMLVLLTILPLGKLAPENLRTYYII